MSASVVGRFGGLHVGGSVQRMWPDADGSPVPPGGGVALIRAAFSVGDGVGEGDGESSWFWGDLGRLKEDIAEREGVVVWGIKEDEV